MSVPSNTLSPRDNEITELLPEQLAKLLASGKFSSREVTTAFLRRAALAQKLVSMIEIHPIIKVRITHDTTGKLHH